MLLLSEWDRRLVGSAELLFVLSGLGEAVACDVAVTSTFQGGFSVIGSFAVQRLAHRRPARSYNKAARSLVLRSRLTITRVILDSLACDITNAALGLSLFQTKPETSSRWQL